MSVSVIIPCFNQGRFLAEAIESAQNQTCPPDEIIVIDDGSTDNTAEVARRYPGVRYFYQENRGLFAARNAGFRASTGTFLIFLDSDDRLTRLAVESGLAALRAAPEAAFAYGRNYRISVDGRITGERHQPKRDDCYRDLLKDNYIPTPGMVLFRRSAIERFGLFDPKLTGVEDYDLYLRIARQQSITLNSEITLERRIHPQAMTQGVGRMLRFVLQAHQRQWRYARHDPELREAYFQGRDWWKGWYGGQLLTRLLVERHLGQWRSFLRNLMTLLLYCPALASGLLKPVRLSAPLLVRFSRTGRLEHAPTPDSGNRRRPIQAQPNALEIIGFDFSLELHGNGAAGQSRSSVLATIACTNATMGTRVVVDGSPVDSATLTPTEIQAFLPASLLNQGRECKIYLAG